MGIVEFFIGAEINHRFASVRYWRRDLGQLKRLNCRQGDRRTEKCWLLKWWCLRCRDCLSFQLGVHRFIYLEVQCCFIFLLNLPRLLPWRWPLTKLGRWYLKSRIFYGLLSFPASTTIAISAVPAIKLTVFSAFVVLPIVYSELAKILISLLFILEATPLSVASLWFVTKFTLSMINDPSYGVKLLGFKLRSWHWLF
jgi:hypothetical protein